ncbi:MAG: hypothetical protein DWQ01_03930 [Planctomycetota bacterium]|nr:MAG: hypothetical protein DWQ01_03930 [Planctomycetota bacterium]
MKKVLLLVIVCCFPMVSAFGQRQPQSLAPCRVLENPSLSVASSGELSVAAYTCHESWASEILVCLSDGRGLAWSAPQRVDQGTGWRTSQVDSLWIHGSIVVLIWKDERLGWQYPETYFNYSADGGLTWGMEQRIPNGFSAGTVAVRKWRAWAEADGAELRLHLIQTVDDGNGEELFYTTATSVDFQFQTPLLLSEGGRVMDCALMAQGDQVHVVWSADPNQQSQKDLWYQHSSNNGLHWLGQAVRLSSSGSGDLRGRPQIRAFEDKLAVAFREARGSNLRRSLRLALSHDGGLNWQAEQQVGQYDADSVNVDSFDFEIGSWGMQFVWIDSRQGLDLTYGARTPDFGSTWLPDQLFSTLGLPADEPHLARNRLAPGSTDQSLLVFWREGAGTRSVQGVFSVNGGEDWSTRRNFSPTLTWDCKKPIGVRNAAYNNWILLWSSYEAGNNAPFVGGVRNAEHSFLGQASAGSPVQFSVQGFQPANNSHAVILFSGGEGNWPLPEAAQRNTGLFADAYLAWSVILGNGPLLAPLDSQGSGTTPIGPWPASIPSGTRLYTVAVGLNLHAAFAFGEISELNSFVVQ